MIVSHSSLNLYATKAKARRLQPEHQSTTTIFQQHSIYWRRNKLIVLFIACFAIVYAFVANRSVMSLQVSGKGGSGGRGDGVTEDVRGEIGLRVDLDDSKEEELSVKESDSLLRRDRQEEYRQQYLQLRSGDGNAGDATDEGSGSFDLSANDVVNDAVKQQDHMMKSEHMKAVEAGSIVKGSAGSVGSNANGANNDVQKDAAKQNEYVRENNRVTGKEVVSNSTADGGRKQLQSQSIIPNYFRKQTEADEQRYWEFQLLDGGEKVDCSIHDVPVGVDIGRNRDGEDSTASSFLSSRGSGKEQYVIHIHGLVSALRVEI
eukprot:g14604.t1 g14604   contig9:2253582-2254660(+)